MEDLKIKLSHLINKAGWTREERRWLLQYLKRVETTELQSLLFQEFEENKTTVNEFDPEVSKEILHNIYTKIKHQQEEKKAPLVKMWILRIAAACFIGLLGLGVYLVWNNNNKQGELASKKQLINKKYKSDVLPGGNKAVLVLADGSSIVLDDVHNGALAQQGHTKVIKINGKLAYNTSASRDNEVLYNTISTPRGGQYQVELPDGTQVWLNAASSLHFPTAFAGKERKVEVTGEAYFEVAKNKSMPFIVKVKDAEIRVLGTHFNVMAYNDEASVKTTLLEGSVSFVKDNIIATIKPGQQSQLLKDGSITVVDNVDVVDVMAWKNGIFHFQGEDIGTILRQLTRWYDVEIVYNKTVKDIFYAEIPRNTKLSDVLKALELTGKVHFQIDERKIIVMP